MNIFVLDEHPELAARYHNDRHVPKQIFETAQILCTAHVVLDGDAVANNTLKGMPMQVLRPTHMHHPCVLWAQASGFNYDWLHQLGEALLKEYSTRFSKTHSYHDAFNVLRKKPMLIECHALRTQWPQCMPLQYMDDDPVEAYRKYYFREKGHLAAWSPPASIPWWWTNMKEGRRHV